jgi:ubiquinone biosynthesis protein UbiJ
MPRMLQALPTLLAPPVLERLTLVLNHVLGAEAVAQERMRAHQGRLLVLQLGAWPALLPPPPPLAWRVTPAGLLEWAGLEPGPGGDLTMSLDAANPAALLARALLGERPPVQIDGDAQLAADVGWLLQNLRWDVAADLERLFPRPLAQQLHQLGRALARGLRGALDAGAPLAARFGAGGVSRREGGGAGGR